MRLAYLLYSLLPELIGHSFVTVPAMDDAAIGETFLGDGISHHLVVAMGVDADIVVVE